MEVHAILRLRANDIFGFVILSKRREMIVST